MLWVNHSPNGAVQITQVPSAHVGTGVHVAKGHILKAGLTWILAGQKKIKHSLAVKGTRYDSREIAEKRWIHRVAMGVTWR